jgi:serine/threonine protein kinase
MNRSLPCPCESDDRSDISQSGISISDIPLSAIEYVPQPKVDSAVRARRAPRSSPPPVPSSRPALVPGRVVGGRYRLVRKVGAGGMGEVWCAEHLRLRMPVAVKILLGRGRGVPEIVARFEREARLLGRLRGDHVPQVMDFFDDDVLGPVLVTELVDGESLAKVLEKPLTVEQAVELGIDLADALSHLHRANVVHRDLKPSNVILRPGADGARRATILDLGVSRLLDAEDGALEAADITAGDVVLGTLEYMAPEQIVSCGLVTPGADLYALGALLFRATTGVHVFGRGLDKLDVARAKLTRDAPALRTGRTDAMATGFAAVVGRALERCPSARYASAEALREDLVALRSPGRPNEQESEPASGPGIEAAPVSAIRAPRSTKQLVAVAVGFLLLGLAGLAPQGEGGITSASGTMTEAVAE